MSDNANEKNETQKEIPTKLSEHIVTYIYPECSFGGRLSLTDKAEWKKDEKKETPNEKYLLPEIEDRLFSQLESKEYKGNDFKPSKNGFDGIEIQTKNLGILKSAGKPLLTYVTLSISGSDISQVQNFIAETRYRMFSKELHKGMLRTNLCHDVFNFLRQNGIEMTATPFDDRAYIVALYNLNKGTLPSGNALRSLIDIDPVKGYDTSDTFAEQWLAPRVYRRWESEGVLYGFTHHSFIGVKARNNCKVNLVDYFSPPQGYYFKLALLGFAHKLAMMRDAGVSTNCPVVSLPESVKNGFISHSDQARALWRTWMKAMEYDMNLDLRRDKESK